MCAVYRAPVSDVLRALIHRSAARCFAAFCDPRLLTVWVPGLRKTRAVLADDAGRPREVLFEFGDRLVYSLVYTYDPVRRRVDWRPGVGRRDAVAGFAQFDEAGDDCEMSYQLLPSGEREVEARPLLDAFVRWIEAGPAR